MSFRSTKKIKLAMIELLSSIESTLTLEEGIKMLQNYYAYPAKEAEVLNFINEVQNQPESNDCWQLPIGNMDEMDEKQLRKLCKDFIKQRKLQREETKDYIDELHNTNDELVKKYNKLLQERKDDPANQTAIVYLTDELLEARKTIKELNNA